MTPRYHGPGDLPARLPLFPLTGALLLPRAGLPLNIFEPRYLQMVDHALSGDRLIGMIQPTEHEDSVLRPALARIGCAGRITSYRETDDNRYLITLTGICRFRLIEEADTDESWRLGLADFSPFTADLHPPADEDLPRERLLKALKTYLNSRDLQADWNSVLSAPGEALVSALAMMCPFDAAEKQALLEAPDFDGRVSTLLALLEMGGEARSATVN